MAPGVSGGIAPADAPELLAGYRVLRQIGQGGMGVVYEAEHPRLSRKLAIKVLIGQKKHSTVPERFRREAEAASRLNHPHIVSVFDFGEQNGVQYLAMAMIDGVSLDVMLDQYRAASRSGAETRSSAGLLTMVTAAPAAANVEAVGEQSGSEAIHRIIGADADFRQLARLGADIASALSHAHQNGTIHRDIKPGNLILDRTGKIWVTDFGLAKVLDDRSDLSRTGDVIGTPRFMAPEQLRGHCDERSDIYSLGITLYEMASGTRAWDSLTTAQLLKIRASADLPELEEQAPFVPRPLAEIIMKACSYRPEDRYQSAQEMQRLGCGKDSLERGWRLVARGLFIDSTLHQSRLSPSSGF
jgi:serine/threonine protein kinase